MHNRGIHRLLQRGPAPCAPLCTTRRPRVRGTRPGRAERSSMDRCDALLAAGLAAEAVDLVGGAGSHKGALPAAERADLLLALARAELAGGDARLPCASAQRARTLFRRQRRDWDALTAPSSPCCVRGQRSGRADLVASAPRSRRGWTAGGSDQAAEAWLLAGRAALGGGSGVGGRAARPGGPVRRRSSALVRATGWRALALERDALGDSRGVLAACRRGLDALDEHRASLGQLRAAGAGDPARRRAGGPGPASRGRERARVLLEWSERWRATALAQPPVHPPDDEELAEDLAALRDTRRRLAEARADGVADRRQAGRGPGAAGARDPAAGPPPRAARRRRRRASRPSELVGDARRHDVRGARRHRRACCTRWSPRAGG